MRAATLDLDEQTYPSSRSSAAMRLSDFSLSCMVRVTMHPARKTANAGPHIGPANLKAAMIPTSIKNRIIRPIIT